MLQGCATLKATREYLQTHGWEQKEIRENTMFASSPVGLGNHLGSFEEEESMAYVSAMTYGLEHGINVLDTAINYRGMRSEKDTGQVLRRVIEEEKSMRRDELVVSTKAGLLFGDITKGMRPAVYLEEILKPRGVRKELFQGNHTMQPEFYREALEISRANLGLETIDIHYIHIPEISRAELGEEEFYRRLSKLFEWYEQVAEEGKIRFYGFALELMLLEDKAEWNISLEKAVEVAEAVAGKQHHFRSLQLPFSKQVPDAVTRKSQSVKGVACTVTEAAVSLGMTVMGSMPFAMGRNFETWSVEEMLVFCLRTKEVQTTVCGSKNPEHIRELLKIAGNRLVS